MEKRNGIFDSIKALAIWLVVLGHCIQVLSGLDYWNNELFQFIYSFHMPLFFMVSGFFFASSQKLSLIEFLRKKSLTLLLPCFVWGVVLSLCDFQSWSAYLKDIFFPTHWPFWFFKGLFLVQLVAYLSLRVAQANGGGQTKHLLFAIMASISVYTMPYMGVPRVMIPMFWIGYIMKMYYEQYIRYHRIIGVIALVAFAGLYYFWNGDIMHYSATASVTLYHLILGKHGYTMMNILWLAYRILLGATGSIAIISAMHEVKSVNNYITVVGASTAGIYVLHTFILQGLSVLMKFMDMDSVPLCANFIIMVMISIAVTIFVTMIYRLLRKNEILDMLLFGSGEKVKIITNT